MGIKFRCHACDKKLHVKAFLAGRRGVCPKCGAKVRIPAAGDDSSNAPANGREAHRRSADAVPPRKAVATHGKSPAAVSQQATLSGTHACTAGRAAAGSGTGTSSTHDPIADSPEAVWYVRPPTGGQFGPADGTVMRRWLSEGRVSADALVWREGWSEWKSAGPVFPSLEATDSFVPASSPAAAADPVDDDFLIAEQRRGAGRYHPRTRPKPARNTAAIMGILVVVGAVLVVVFVLVLRA